VGRAASIADDSLILKDGDTFAVFDEHGDIPEEELSRFGMFVEDTRMLSAWTLTLNGRPPNLLSSGISDDRVIFAADLNNPAGEDAAGVEMPAAVIHLLRVRVLHDGDLLERICITNHWDRRVHLAVEFGFAADFRDIFEVRGARRGRQGHILESHQPSDAVEFGYRGLDGRLRATRITFAEPPSRLDGSKACFLLHLEPESQRHIIVRVATGQREGTPVPGDFRRAVAGARRRIRTRLRTMSRVRSGSELLNEWIEQARADLALLITDMATGPYPYAGIPWFSTAFGRDAIITALEVLWLSPGLARGVLSYLGERQAEETSRFADSDPGKILHEARKGEMSATGEVPFGAYFGGVDTTPLFVVLAAEYYRRTGDLEFTAQLWPRIKAALDWIDRFGDRDGDGFVEYERGETSGLANQGWKDSEDSVFHADGRLARGPIALCEVQGYVYAARQGAAEIAHALGHVEQAEFLRRSAEGLRQAIEETFWSRSLGGYALALDGDKRPCEVRTSNPGHLLFCGVPSPERAHRVADSLLSPVAFSGWGVRTVAEGEARYNPMSYHNGSIWPHDNALIAEGFGRYRLRDHTLRLFKGMFSAAMHLPQPRLPELFCGFPRRPGQGPTAYPVACLPQAWSSAAVFMLIKACLGLRVDGINRRVLFDRPRLPPELKYLDIRQLGIGEGRLSLLLTAARRDTDIAVRQRHGEPVQVILMK
jgi:glycogen debranching enzyme